MADIGPIWPELDTTKAAATASKSTKPKITLVTIFSPFTCVRHAARAFFLRPACA